jgi:uncharacterized membrane protein
MTRADFMARLRRGLSALSANAQSEITADYEAHFSDAAAAGRSEEEAAAALGDPDRLARELRAEYGLKAWEDTAVPSSATTAGRASPSWRAWASSAPPPASER